VAKRRGPGLALFVAIVALALGGFGCGGNSSGSGTGGSGALGGKGGHGGSTLTGTGGAGQLGGESGGGTSGETGGSSGGGASGATGGGSGGGTSGGGAGGHGGVAGQGGSSGSSGAGGQSNHDGGTDAATTDAARDAEATDAHHADAATDAHADGSPTCSNACVLGSHRCAGGGSETCVAGSDGCTQWGSAAACQGATTCVTATGVCTCPAAPSGCTAVGSFCNGSGEVVTCAKDAQGCFTGGTPQVCPTDESCHGSLPNAACACDNDPSCNGTTSYCLNSSTVATCGHDGNTPACNVVVSTTGCHGSSTCAGGACVCPAVGTTAGTGCATLNSTTCSGSDILTCVTESSSGCSIWQASTHCGSTGLTCGTKAGAGPACQCPENTGTDVYVDPVAGSDVAAGVYPTGVQGPAACRYASLTYSLTKVGSPGRIIAISANPPVTFSGETFPLAIPTSVSVITADAVFNASNYIISYGGGTTAVTLANGSALRGFEIDASGGANAIARCSAGSVTLDTVVLGGGGFVTDGLDVTGTCNATLSSVSSLELTNAALNMTGSGTVSITTGVLSASFVGLAQNSGTVTATGLSVQGNGTYGVRLATGGAGTPSLTISGQSVVSNNGSTGSFAGVSIAKGNVSLTDTQVSGNSATGLDLGGTGTFTLNNVQVTGNGTAGTLPGVSLAGGTVTATSLSANSNTGDGVTISSGTGSFTSSSFKQNGGNGLTLTTGSADVNGGLISGNTGLGIAASAGTLTMEGNAEVASNGSDGVQLAGAATTINGANIHDNLGNGVSIGDPTAVIVHIGSASTTTTIAGNGNNGILVKAAASNGTGSSLLVINNVALTSNSKSGVYLQGTSGSIVATVQSSKIGSNGDVGVLVEQGSGNATSSIITGNDISGNHVASTAHIAAGVLFNTASTLGASNFISNKIHGNVGGAQLGFNAAPGPTSAWVIRPQDGNACTDGTANAIYCYDTAHAFVGLIASAAATAHGTLDAGLTAWTHLTPNSTDFSGNVGVTPACAAVTASCP